MAMIPGAKFVRRQDGARTSVSNTTVARYSYDTAVADEGSGFGTWTSDAVSVDTAGRYLIIHGTGEVADGATRSVGTSSVLVDGTTSLGLNGLTTHRYLRGSGGADEGVSLGVAIVDASAGETYGSRIDGTTFSDAVGDFDVKANISGGAFQVVYLGTGDLCQVSRSTAQSVALSNIPAVRPWLESSGSWTAVSWPTEDSDPAGWHSAASSDIVIPANTKVAIAWTLRVESSDASRQSGIARLVIDGVSRQYSSAYHRNTASQGAVANGLLFWETGASSETLYIEATQEAEGTDNGTLTVTGSLSVCELPSSTEWVHVDNGLTDSNTSSLAGTSTWYESPLSSTFRSDGNSRLSLIGASDAVRNSTAGSLSVLAVGSLKWDRDTTTNSRKVPASTVAIDGSPVMAGIGGAFSRGQQSNDDTFNANLWCGAAVDLAAGSDLTLVTRDRANSSNNGMGLFASTGSNRHFLGFQVLDLQTLDAAATHNLSAPTLSSSVSVPAATVSRTITLSPAVLGISVSVPAPSVSRSITLSPAVLGISVSVPAATVSTLSTHTLSAPTLSSSVSVPAATVSRTITLSPAVLGVSITVPAPSVSRSITLSPAVLGVSVSVPAPSVSRSITLSPAVLGVSVSVPAPSVSRSITLSPAVLGVSVSVPAASVSRSITLSPAVLGVSVSVPAPSVSRSITLSPAVLEVSVSVPAPTVSTLSTHTLSAPTLSSSVSVPAATVSRSITLSPAVLGISVSVPAPSVSRSITLSPAVLGVSVSVPAATVSIAAATHTLSAPTLSSSVSVPAATVSRSITLSPAVLGVSVSVPAASVSTLSTHTLSAPTLSSSVSVPAPSVSRSITLSPAVLGVSVSVPAPSVSRSITLSPAVLEVSVSVPAATAVLSVAGSALRLLAGTVEIVRVSTSSESSRIMSSDSSTSRVSSSTLEAARLSLKERVLV